MTLTAIAIYSGWISCEVSMIFPGCIDLCIVSMFRQAARRGHLMNGIWILSSWFCPTAQFFCVFSPSMHSACLHSARSTKSWTWSRCPRLSSPLTGASVRGRPIVRLSRDLLSVTCSQLKTEQIFAVEIRRQEVFLSKFGAGVLDVIFGDKLFRNGFFYLGKHKLELLHCGK